MAIASKKLNKKPIAAALLLLITAALLVACGDTPTDTPAAAIPFTTTAAASGAAPTTAAASTSNGTPAASTTGAASNPGTATGANPSNGTPGANRAQFNVVSGTVVSYDATSKSLTVKAADGTSQIFDATNANISKDQKITLADLSKLTLNTEIVQVTGEKAADGTYSATALTLADPNMFAGNANGAFPGNGGTPGTGAGANGTPGAARTRNPNATPGAARTRNPNATPGAARTRNPNATPGANVNPGAGFGGGFGGANGAGNRLMVRNAVISGNQLTGTDATGAAVTVNLTDSTAITHRTSDTATDLTTGQKISVNYRMVQNTNAAVAITVEQ